MTLRYLLDTNICIYIAKKKPKAVIDRFSSLHVGSVGMSIITYGELYYGAKKSQHPKKAKDTLDALADLILPLDMPVTAASHYGAIRADLEKKGTIIGGNDLWIAAHALAGGLILVTNNEKEFSRVSKLKVENWV